MTNNTSQFRGVRSSKFRHVYGQVSRKEKCYDNIKITKDAHDSNCCAVNPKFLAIITEVAGGGAFAVLPLENTGRLDLTVAKVTGHTGPVLDIKWNPFNDNVIASCSEDCTVKLWHIPDGGFTGSMTQWIVDLRAHKRRCTYIEWHPTADNILLSAGFDHVIIVWNISNGEMVNVIDCHTDVIYSMSLNRDGSLLATTCKDKKLRIIEPRSGQVVNQGLCHVGSKASKVVYLGDTGRLFTTGFSRQSDRQYGVWDESHLDTPLRMETIDSSSGVLFPFYDPDTRMVYVAGKGDGNIRYYEIVDGEPWIHFLSQFLSGSPQRGLGIMPKRGCNTSLCEVFRFYKLHATRGLCEPISMIVPRKSELFQDDLYPDTAAPTPALSADEWIRGVNQPPVLMSLKTGVSVQTYKPVRFDPVEKKLLTSDKNNDKKFAFLTQETVVDYRPIEMRTADTKAVKTTANLGTKLQNMQQVWAKPTRSATQLNINASANIQPPVAPVQRTATLGNFLPPERKIDIVDKPSSLPQDLRKVCDLQTEEIRRLKQQLVLKDRRIRELEEQLRRLKN